MTKLGDHMHINDQLPGVDPGFWKTVKIIACFG